MIAYYQLFRKRKHTKHARFRDYIGIPIIASREHPPFIRGTGIGMFKIHHQDNKVVPTINDLHIVKGIT